MVPPWPLQEHVAVGNLNLDISLKLDRFPAPDENMFAREAWIGPGGAATNYAVAVARLGHKSRLVARAGEDALRLDLLGHLERLGVDTSDVQVAKGEQTGTVVVIIVPKDSSRTLLTIRGANEGLTGSIVPTIGDVVHFASVRPRVIMEATIGGRLASYDPGGEVYRDPAGVLRVMREVDILFLNERELRAVAGSGDLDVLSELVGGRLRIVVIKRGRGGALLYSDGCLYYAEPPGQSAVVDVTGAGDAFDAAFNVAYFATRDPVEALRWAVAAGAAKVARKGSINMPLASEVEELALRVKVGRG